MLQSRRARGRDVLAGAASTRTLTATETAWVASLPCALLLLAAMALVARPLGRLLFEPRPSLFWPFWRGRLGILPEPSEHASYVLALLAPVALSAAVALGVPRRPRLPSAVVRVAVRAAQALVAALAAVSLVAQHAKLYGYPWSEPPTHQVWFTWPTLAVAALIAAAIALVLHSPPAVDRLLAWTRETTARRIGATTAATAFTALWLSTAINTDSTILNAHYRIFVNVPYLLDEPFAVLDGRAPLVSFNAQYGHLLAYVTALPMALLSPSMGLYTVVMTTGSALAMLALFALLRRIVRRSLVALGLFAALLATSFFTEAGPLVDRHGPQTLFSVFPLRYLGPYVLAWATVRHLDGAAPRRRPLLFAIAGLVVLNNVEFGLPALAATFLAVAIANPAPSWARVGALAADAVLGLLGALLAVSLLTLVVAGALPHLGMLLTFPRIYGADGYANMPMPKLGLHVAIYLTLAAAAVVAVVRWRARSGEPLLTAMLLWSGVFGLGAASYWVGRSMPEALVELFSLWALALVLLLVASARAILARPRRRPTLAELTVLFGFGIAVCSIAQTPTPWGQLARLRDTAKLRPYADPPAERAIRAATHRGERVAILNPVGHRIAYALGLVNVSPYSYLEAMPTPALLSNAVAALRSAGGTKLFLPLELTHPEQLAWLQQAGFAIRRVDQRADVIELVDATR